MSYQTIYDRLRAGWIGEAGALGLLGNWECESNCEACRLQGDFSPSRIISREYASKVDNALMSDEAFANDAKGWGLAMWTFWSRKAALLRWCRFLSVSIANEEAQVDFALKELREEYPSLLAMLQSSDDVYQCVIAVCREYERPAVDNIDARYQAALRIKAMIATEKDSSSAAPPQNDTEREPVEDTPETAYWPPRMLCAGMTGADVMALQALLYAHGYNAGSVSGIFDNRTRNMTLAYQAENGLVADGIAGPKTWVALLGVR